MNRLKQKRLERSGWKVGTAKDFLGLSEEEAAFVEVKLRLASELANRRRDRGLTQDRAAKLFRSSQSRVAKMEAADPTVSADLLIRCLLKLGATRKELAKAIGA